MKTLRHNIRISISLVCLTLLIVFLANGLGFIPDENKLLVRERVNLSESIAIQFSVAIQEQNYPIIDATAKSIVKRNSQIKSIILQTIDGIVIVQQGELPEHDTNELTSTPNLIKVPIFRDNKVWGSVEIQFLSTNENPVFGAIGSTFLQLITFFSISGFVLYFLLIRKLLTHLDPYKAIPLRVKKALDAVSDGIVFIDETGRIVLSNKAFEEKIKLNSEDLMGKKLSSLHWATENNSSTFPWEQTLNNNSIHNHAPIKVQPLRSEPLTLVTSSTPIQNAKGSISGALVSFNDVTEFEKVSNELESMTKFLRHELNNALVGASGMVSLLEKSDNLSDDDKNIIKRTQRLHQVIKHLLESVREARSIEASFTNEELSTLRLDTLLSDMTANYTDIYQTNQFSFNTDEEEINILGQEERLIQMLDKLVSNAVEHSTENSPIKITCNTKEGKAVIKITNQGNRLPDDKQKIFDLFTSFRSNKEDKHNQGIGLYVVKLIAEAYGGSVEARDTKNSTGSEFIIKLPILHKES